MFLLFRSEALAHQQQKLYGTILLARPLSFTAITLLFIVMAAGLIAFFLLFGFSRKEVVPGVLLPEHGLIRIYAQQPGVVLERKVYDGQIVKQGDVLFVMSSERSSSAKGDTQSAIGETLTSRITRLRNELSQQQQQTRQQQAALDKRRIALKGQQEQIDSEIALQQKRVQLAEASTQRYTDLQKSNFISEAQVQEKSADLLDQQSRLRILERGRSSLAVDVSTIEADLRDLPLRAQREASGIERSITELEQGIVQNEAQRELVVRATQAGRITALTAEPGQGVVANQALATLLPVDDKLEAELYAPTRSIGFIKPGAKVLVRYQAFPYQKFGQHEGVVREITRSALQPGEIGTLMTRDPASTEPLYRIRVALNDQAVRAYGYDEALRAGMQLDASLVLEHRKLYEWIIEPLYSVTGRL
jgi:membrane fusion protein